MHGLSMEVIATPPLQEYRPYISVARPRIQAKPAAKGFSILAEKALVTGMTTISPLPAPDEPDELERLLQAIGKCRICVATPRGRPLPHPPRPVVVASRKARILIAGQAPGVRVHASGRPFSDPSGNRLRQWLGVDSATFYNPDLFAIVPMGFCFPGQDAKGGDLPPRRECAPAWRAQLLRLMPQIRLVLAIGQHAQAWHLGRRASLNDIVSDWRHILAETAESGTAIFPLPHPSWRNSGWLRRNPWFEAELIPALRREIGKWLSQPDCPE